MAYILCVDERKVSEDEKQRIREAKQKFMQIEKSKNEPKPQGSKRVGKLKREEQPVKMLADDVDETEAAGAQNEDESLDLQERLQGIDTHHEGYGE